MTEGEAEDRVVAGSNPALGTLMDFGRNLRHYFLKNLSSRNEKLDRMKKQLAELETAVATIRDVIPSDLLVRLQLEKLHREKKTIPEEERPKNH